MLYSKDQRSLIVCQVIHHVISHHIGNLLVHQVLLHNTREVKKMGHNIIVVPCVDHIVPKYILRF